MSHLLTLVCCLVWVSVAWAAPAVIGTPASGNNGAATGTSLTFAATCPSGNTNVLAVLCANVRRFTASVPTPSATWNGTAMSSVGAADLGESDSSHAEMFILTNPTCDSASHNAVITLASSNMIVGNIIFLKDVNLTTPVDTPATATGTTVSPPTVNVTSATGDLVVDCVTARNSNTNLVVGPGQTLQTLNQNTHATTFSTNGEGGQSTEPGAATVTMSWTLSAATASWGIVGVSVNPAAVATRRNIAPRHYLRHWQFPFLFHTARMGSH